MSADTVTNSIVARLIEANRPIYLICTGAGAGLQGMIWNTPGVSKILIGAEFPYAREATISTLGFEPKRFCSEETALHLAMAAFYKAGSIDAIGLGLTASVASVEEHRGDHRVHVATFCKDGCWVQTITLEKGLGFEPRVYDGQVCDAIGLAALSLAMIGKARKFIAAPESSDRARALFFERPFFTATGKRHPTPVFGKGDLLFPGAFNPPHYGHFGMLEAGRKAAMCLRDYPQRTVFTTTANPPHKEPLSVADMLYRAKLLEGHDRVFTIDDPLYIDKARKNPGASFVIGADAILRMLDPAWGHSPMDLCQEFKKLETTFYVAPREVPGKGLVSLDNIDRPDTSLMFVPINGSWNVSSSDIRAKQK